jgi:hypothetical protein
VCFCQKTRSQCAERHGRSNFRRRKIFHFLLFAMWLVSRLCLSATHFAFGRHAAQGVKPCPSLRARRDEKPLQSPFPNPASVYNFSPCPFPLFFFPSNSVVFAACKVGDVKLPSHSPMHRAYPGFSLGILWDGKEQHNMQRRRIPVCMDLIFPLGWKSLVALNQIL